MSDAGRPGATITCLQVVELVTDYLEGALDGPTHAEVDAHLRLCPGCAEYLRQLRIIIRELGHLPADALSDQLKDELMAAFRGYRPPAPA